VSGKLINVAAENHVLRFQRTEGKDRILVLLNMAAEPTQVAIEAGTVMASTHLDREGKQVSGQTDLRAAEGLVVNLT
jgi:alpha-glucosidase